MQMFKSTWLPRKKCDLDDSPVARSGGCEKYDLDDCPVGRRGGSDKNDLDESHVARGGGSEYQKPKHDNSGNNVHVPDETWRQLEISVVKILTTTEGYKAGVQEQDEESLVNTKSIPKRQRLCEQCQALCSQACSGDRLLTKGERSINRTGAQTELVLESCGSAHSMASAGKKCEAPDATKSEAPRHAGDKKCVGLFSQGDCGS